MDDSRSGIIKKEKILVALSGGADSAVAAMLLKKQGYDVLGVHLRLFGKTWKLSSKVKKIVEKLEIPLKIIDARRAFKKKIIDYFLDAYQKGITPNPCVVCNKEIKFRLLFKLMKKYEADFISTGHYARIARQSSAFSFVEQSSPNFPKPSFNYKLLEAKDKNKDQSYFLYRLTQRELAKIIFPLGNYTKNEVRNIAKKLKLPVEKNESQDVCFLGLDDLNMYLNKYLKISRGRIIDETGRILGKHKGLPLYTIGQRKGIEIGGARPYFVVEKKLRRNELVVSNSQADPRLFNKLFGIKKANWSNKDQKFPLKAKARVRYQTPFIDAIIKKDKNGKFKIELKKPIRALTPGQSAVFYQGEEVLGGGIIV